MVGDGRTRRVVSGALSALVLLLGLYAVLESSPSPSPATVTAVLADGAPAAHRTLDPGPQPRLTRHAPGKPLSGWAMLLATVAGGVALRRWSSPARAVAAPAARGRFIRDSRAPPLRSRPA